MKSALGVLFNAAAFAVVARFLPGVVLQAGKSVPRLAAVALVAGVFAVLVLRTVRRRRATSSGRSTVGSVLAAWLAVAAAEVVFLIALAVAGPAASITFRIGDIPGALSLGSVVVLAAAALVLGGAALAVERGTSGVRGRAVRPSSDEDRARSIILAIFLMSGAAGLIYEVVWARQLVLVFGNTTQAVSAILTGYFGGLAIGAVVGGRLADRSARPLRLYGLLEIALVGVVLITPLLFRGVHELYRPAYATLETQPTLLALVRYGLALLALAPATVLMGATLPTLSRHLAARGSGLSGAFGRLYAANTFGAIVGTLLAGLILIEILGLTLTLVVGAAASATAGVAAIVLDRRGAGSHQREATPAPPIMAAAPTSAPSMTVRPSAIASGGEPPSRGLAFVLAFVSGLTSLGYQVLWTRMLSSGSGNTTYVFTLILATFLIGIALGAAFVARRTTRARTSVAVLGSLQLLVATVALAGLVVLSGNIPSLPLVVRVILVVLPATLAMGVMLPLASGFLDAAANRVGRDTGLLLGANTLGTILGTFAVPFVLIPAVGSPRSVVILVLVNVALGLVLITRRAPSTAVASRVPRAAGAVVATIAVLGLIVPNPLVRDPGATRLLRDSVLLADAEDEIAAVQAGGTAGDRQLLVAGTGMTRLTVDAKLMAYLPIIARPDSQRMLVIAFGMGSAFRSGIIANLRVDGVELVPSVVDMFEYFYPDGNTVLANPAARLVITDGRNYVELSDNTYDIVVVDPPPPIESSGTSVLYSREFYAASAGRLNPGGVMMEWMPYGQSVDEFRAHVQTFASVFPDVVIAFGPTRRGVYMLGSTDPIRIDDATVRAVLARQGVLADLVDTVDAPVSSAADWTAIIDGLTWIGGDDVRRFAGSAPLIVDDRPATEYFLLRRSFGPTSPRMTEANLRNATP